MSNDPMGASREHTDNEVLAALPAICALLKRSTGRDFSEYKSGILIGRIRRRAQLLELASVADYVARLEQDVAEPERLFKHLLLGAGQFFADEPALAAFAELAVPRTLATRRAQTSLRVWVSGCATGEEAYSLSIVLREVMARLGTKLSLQLFATDVDKDALAVARAGLYPARIAQQLSAARLSRFFERTELGYKVIDELREGSVFSLQDLVRDPPFSSLDLICCRSIMWDLVPELQKRVRALFHFALRPSGYLLLGPLADATAQADLFDVVHSQHGILKRKDGVARPRVEFPLWSERLTAAARTPGRGSRRILQQSIESMLLDDYAPACVVVDERGEMLCSAGNPTLYFRPGSGSDAGSLVEHVQPELRQALRSVLHEAMVNARLARVEATIEQRGEPQAVRLSVRPAPRSPQGSPAFAVIFEDLGASRTAARATEPLRSEASAIEQLERELAGVRADLRATVAELEQSNEELRSANEELMSANEELRASHEQLEAVNQQLESSKHEQVFANQQLQSYNADLCRKMVELEAARRALLALNERVQRILGSITEGYYSLDSEWRFIEANPAAERHFDRPAAALLGSEIWQLTGIRSGSELRQVFERAVIEQQPIQFESESEIRPGCWYEMHLHPRPGALDVYFHDISERRRAEQALKQSTEHYRVLAETAPDLITRFDSEMRLVYANRAAQRRAGSDERAMLHKTTDELAPAQISSEWEARLREVLRSGVPTQFEICGARGDVTRWFDVRMAPEFSANGSVASVVAIARDVTDRKLAEQALREADQRKNEFLAVLSHELRNPLAPINNSLYLLERAVPGGEQARRAKAVIDRQVAQLTRLVDDLLDITRITRNKIALRRELLDVNQVLTRTVEDHRLLFEQRELELCLELPSDGATVSADPNRLAQVVGNLLQNAAKFTSPGGSVHVHVSIDAARGHACIRVRDTGIGIPPEIQARLFEPFMQACSTIDRSQGGLGLGLALVKGLVELHGGEVGVHSEGAGKGAEFTVALPLARSGTRQTEPPLPAPRHRPRRVLIIEDHLDAANSLRDALQLLGHAVEVAHDGAAGIAKARELRPDVVLCDIGLPGMDGYDVARAFRADAQLKHTVLVALSGYAQPDDIERAKQAGFERHLAKPPTLAVLEGLIVYAPDSQRS